MLMRPTLLLLSLVVTSSLLGCIRANDIYLTDGSIGHSIDCDGQWLSIETCFEKAAELCGMNGFKTVTRDGIETGRTIAKGSTDINASAFSTRTILIRCNDQRPVPKY